MKTNIKQIVSITSLAIITMLCVVSCKDEVLVPVKDNTSSDSLVSLITVLDQQKITVDKKLNKITITNAILNDSIDNLYNAVNNIDRTVEYTINLLNAGTTITSSGRTQGVDGVVVTITQSGSIGAASKTSANGRVVFTGLKQGAATVQIKGTGFASVNASVYLGDDQTYTGGDGAVRSASSNFLLIPIGGTSGLTISGKLYINKSILDDTLGRQYNNGGTLQNKYVSNPSIYNLYNFNGYNQASLYSIYGSTSYSTNSVNKFDALTSGTTVFAYPDLGGGYAPAQNPYNSAGYISSVTYSGLISGATVDATTGAYTISVPYIINGAADGDIGYQIEATPITASLTLLNGDGTTQAVGSVKTTFKSFNVNTYTTTSIDRWVLTQDWIYRSVHPNSTGSYNYFQYGYINGNETTPGGTVYRNIFYFPTERN